MKLFSIAFPFLFLFLFLSPLLSLASVANPIENPHILPRPLILELPSSNTGELEDDSKLDQLWCDSWRFAAEANNLAPWKSIPTECGPYVRDYVTGRAYRYDLETVAHEAFSYAKSVQLHGDGMDVWIFDIDETLLSNLPYYANHGYGLELFNSHEFDKWVEKAVAPAIESSVILYEQIKNLGFKVFLLTGRSEGHEAITVQNLKNVGIFEWDKLILRGANDRGKTATVYKSEKRREIETEGYRIIGNSGDQWSDLLGYSMSSRSFKLPNPMYYIP